MAPARANAVRLAGGFVCVGVYMAWFSLFCFSRRIADGEPVGGPSQGIPVAVLTALALILGLVLASPRWTGKPLGRTLKGFGGPIGGTAFAGFLTAGLIVRAPPGLFWFAVAATYLVGIAATVVYAGGFRLQAATVRSSPSAVTPSMPSTFAATAVPPFPVALPSGEASALVDRALAIIEENVHVGPTC